MFIMQLIIFLQYKEKEIIPSGEFSGEIQSRVTSSQPVVVWSQTISSLQIVSQEESLNFRVRIPALLLSNCTILGKFSYFNQCLLSG